MDDIWDQIGMNVALFRASHNLTQSELAEVVGISRASIANLEAGRQKASLDHLYSIADTLEVTIHDLLPL